MAGWFTDNAPPITARMTGMPIMDSGLRQGMPATTRPVTTPPLPAKPTVGMPTTGRAWQAPASWGGAVPPGLQGRDTLPGPWGQTGWSPGMSAGAMMGQGQMGQGPMTLNQLGQTGMVRMQAPDGSVQMVPSDQVSHFQARGATMAGG